MENILNYIEHEEERYLEELIEYLKIPSISSSPDHVEEVVKCAQWTADKIREIGIEDVRIIKTPGHPIVFAQWLGAGEKAPTILVYGHYDVQPVDPIDLWDSPPFEPVIKNGKIFARGTADDKGQLYVHIKAVEAFFKKNGKPPVNIKFIIEGEEEAGSSNLDNFIEENAVLLKCDYVVVSDTEWFADGMPSICYGLRGISFVEITVTGPNRDLHSGTFGGAIDNPINVLCWMITKLKDSYGRITIPGFYDDVLTLTEDERNGFKKLPYDEPAYCKDLDIEMVNGEIGYTTLERVWGRPSLDLNGIIGGFTEEGAKTVLPSKATAKISMRLVANQDHNDIAKKIEAYLKSIAPPTVKLEFKNLHGGSPVLVERDNKGVKAAMKALKEAFGKEPVFMREGGSIPIVDLFDSVLHAPTVLMGLGLPSDNIHSPNENYELANYLGGIKASAIFFDEMSK